MLIGQTVLAPTTATAYYGPWFPRGGNSLKAEVQFLNKSLALATSLTTFTCEVQTKNNEDADSAATTIGAAFTVDHTTRLGVVTVSASTLTGAKELVRYKFNLQNTGSAAWVHFNPNPPIWLPN